MTALSWPQSVNQVMQIGLIDKVWAQLQKDFALEAIPFDELEGFEPVNLEQIYHALYPIVKKHIQQNFSVITQLLYRMSISEERVTKHLALWPDDAAHAITYLMVCREAEKVILRQNFSSKK
jgi:hypothetical protein